MMETYENDVLVIPKEIQNMSIAEIDAAKEKMLKELLANKERVIKEPSKQNKKQIVFQF